MPIVVGIDLAAGRGTTEVAALAFDNDETSPTPGPSPVPGEGRDGQPMVARFLQGEYRATQRDDEIVAAACAYAPRVIAIDAPLSLPAAVLAALTGAGTPQHPSPYTRAAERDPIWRRLGVRPFPVSFLGGLTFRALTLLPQLRAAAPDATIIEVFPTATLATLGARYELTFTVTGARNSRVNADTTDDTNATAVAAPPPSPSPTPLAPRSSPRGGGQGGGRPPAKTTPIRRAATQASLARWIDDLPDPNAELYGADLLDALAAALTAVAYAHGRYQAVGDPTEGQIILPDW